MKPPPLLLGAALLFWGWQSDLFLFGALLAVIIESRYITPTRWDVSDEDFRRFWNLSMLLFLGAALYAFTTHEGPSKFSNLLEEPTVSSQRDLGLSSARTAASLFRWLPIIFFPFVIAHAFSTRTGIPLTAISLLARRRARLEQRLRGPTTPPRQFHPGYPYLGVCLLAASVHAAENQTYFWGAAVLLAWTLWPQRARRFGVATWLLALGAAIALSYFGQRGVGYFQHYLENINPQWLAQFFRRGVDPTKSQTDIGQVGQRKTSGKIVLRLEPHDEDPPALLREASYQIYKSPTWYAQTGRRDFENVAEDYPSSQSWTLLPGLRKTNSVRIAGYLQGGNDVLPLPNGVSRMENLPAYVIRMNSKGTVLAEGPRLVIYDAFYGPGETIDAPEDDYDDIYPPLRERPALDAVIQEAQLHGLPLAETLARLQSFFAEKFTYSLWQPDNVVARRDPESPLSRFLLHTRSGHCEYYATAATLILRRLDFPARYAVGFAVHEHDGKKYVVRLRDAHAWSLVWDEAQETWLDFDPTPGSWRDEEAKRASPFQWLTDFWERLKFEFAKVRWGQTQLRQYLLWIVIPALLISIYQIVFRRRWRRHRHDRERGVAPPDWPGRDSDFYALERKLTERGLPRQPGEPLSHWLTRVAAQPDLADLREPLDELLHLHYRHRFDPLGLNAADREALRRETRVCLEKMSRPQPVNA